MSSLNNVHADGNPRGVAGGQAAPSAVDMSTLPAGATFTQISTGLYSTCAIPSNGLGYCWGYDMTRGNWATRHTYDR